VAVRRVDWKAAADGAWLAVAITLPPTILVRLFKDGDLDGQESYLWVVPVVALLVGFAVGGNRAAKRRPDAPLLHAAASAACAFAALAALAVVRRFVDGDGLTVPLVVTLMLLLQITVSLAVIGGYVAMRREAATAAGAGSAGATVADDAVPPDPEP
jgi:hypothetical protein